MTDKITNLERRIGTRTIEGAGWPITDTLTCEHCGDPIAGEHYSAADCNETGRGVCLCLPCARAADGVAR